MADAALSCAHCRAVIKDEIDGSKPFFRCSYCGAQNKNPLYESPAALKRAKRAERAAATEAAYAQVKEHQKRYWWVSLVIILPIFIGGAAFSLLMSRRAQQRAKAAVARVKRAAQPAARHVRYVESQQVFPYDANGDGVEDVAMRVWERDWLGSKMTRDEYLIVCLDGKDGKKLWSVPAKQYDVFYRAAGRILRVRTNTIASFDEKSGKAGWVAHVGDKVEQLALVGEQLRVYDKKRVWTGVELATGKLQGKVAEPELVLRSDERPWRRPGYGGLDLQRVGRVFPGFALGAAYCPEAAHSFFNAKGRRVRWPSHRSYCRLPYGLAYLRPSQGTAVPHLAGYDRKTKKKLWLRRLAAEGALETFDGDPRIWMSASDAVLTYKVGKQPHRLERIDLATGRSQWSVTFKTASWSDKPAGLAVAKRVYLTHSRGLHVFDGQTGKALRSIGGVPKR